ncbi:Integral membrane sensor hybrid histidine kinase precursor [Bradyrhizobium sp. STM 3843]|uniref:two-component system VirA-like sensor kinase n=1 Tax=Bradyrhizobium sp. STM 3843 TaxID=551947 RepID=UPI0002404A12|nr:two-component system VirA-like sensor kinase [Bradyrhizobium sp. STM 3843]CCE11709.1 Integral membrane sensor hybrid histidine kinase precursor [Bradyrhizobium sp. STM 3843]
MRPAWAAGIVVILVGVLTWLSLRALNPEAERFDQAFTELNRFGMIENALYRHVFTARAGVLRNYDPLVEDVNALHDSLQKLKEEQSTDATATEILNRLAASVERQEELVEHFKTQNALLQNSLAFFGRFGGQPHAAELDPAISNAAAAILHLALDTSAPTVRDVQDRLDELERQAAEANLSDSVDALLAHGRLLNRLLPSVDNILKTLHGLSQTWQQDQLRATLLNQQMASRASARQYRVLLYITSLLIVGFLVYLGLLLSSHAKALRRRAEFEHIIARISTRFINVAPQELGSEIDRALSDMCAFLKPDRAYFVMTTPTPRVRVWQKPGVEFPPDWPARAPELALQIGTAADGTVQIERVDRMPVGELRTLCMNLGLGGWACATRVAADGITAALGFDAVGRPCPGRAAELPLMRMALDSMVRAVERQSMEQERSRLEARLQQSQRMEQIGFFTSGIAHNFNNILGGILGHSEVIEEHVGSDAKLVRNLGAIRRNAERARDLIDQILVFGRARNAGRKPLSIGALVAESASLLEVSLPDGIDLVIRQPPTAAIVAGEHVTLQQVILNLCRNASNAMPDGGRIEIAIELHDIAIRRSFSHDSIEPGPYVCIAITDTGHGIEPNLLERIFEPFFTTRPSGNGLGLATVREIVREHGGALNVQSTVGEGTRFEIWLPRASAAEPASTRHVGLPTGDGETILLIAQNYPCVLRDEELLAALGYEPVGFSSPDAALAACRAQPERFDLVVVGHCGSASASLQTAAALHDALPRAPIVLASKAAIEIGAETLVAAGIFDVVRWPLVAEEIAITLAHGSERNKVHPFAAPRHVARPRSSLH